MREKDSHAQTSRQRSLKYVDIHPFSSVSVPRRVERSGAGGVLRLMTALLAEPGVSVSDPGLSPDHFRVSGQILCLNRRQRPALSLSTTLSIIHTQPLLTQPRTKATQTERDFPTTSDTALISPFNYSKTLQKKKMKGCLVGIIIHYQVCHRLSGLGQNGMPSKKTVIQTLVFEKSLSRESLAPRPSPLTVQSTSQQICMFCRENTDAASESEGQWVIGRTERLIPQSRGVHSLA